MPTSHPSHRTLALLLGLLLAGCAHQAPTPSAGPAQDIAARLTPDQRAALRAFLTTPSGAAPVRPMHLPGAPQEHCNGNHPRCDHLTIEVGIVRLPLEPGLEAAGIKESDAGACYAIMPYREIQVTKPKPHRTQIIQWTLKSVSTKDKVDENDFEFCRQTGAPGDRCDVDGIEFPPPSGGRLCRNARTDDDFDQPGHGNTKKVFRWRNKHDPQKPSASFCHEANVRPVRAGVAIGDRCLKPDPLIFNQ